MLVPIQLSKPADLGIRPQGVGSARKPPFWLKDGDIVEVGLEGVGTCANKIELIKSRPKL